MVEPGTNWELVPLRLESLSYTRALEAKARAWPEVRLVWWYAVLDEVGDSAGGGRVEIREHCYGVAGGGADG
jgi:hypothetical protein